MYDETYYQNHKSAFNQSRKRYRKKSVKRISLDVHVDWYNVLKSYCDEHDLSVNTFIKEACEQAASMNGYNGFVRYHEKDD